MVGVVRVLRCAAAVLVLLGAGCTAPPPEPPDPTDAVAELFPAPLAMSSTGPLPAVTQSALDQAVTDVVAGHVPGSPFRSNAAGVSVAVVSALGSWSGAAGTDGAGVPLGPDAVFALGEVGASFLAAEALLLAARGELDLDRPAADLVDDPHLPPGATTRELLGLRAGMRDADGVAVPATDVAAGPRTTAEALAAVAAPSGPPGSGPVPSTASLLAAQLVVEAVTSEPLGRSVSEDLLRPSGLDRLVSQAVSAPPAPLAVGEGGSSSDGYLPDRATATRGDGLGALAGDAASLARWTYLLQGGELLGMPAVTEMTDGSGAQLSRSVRATYGLGTMVFGTAFDLEASGYLASAHGVSVGTALVRDTSTAVAVIAVGDDREVDSLVARVVVAASTQR